MSGQHARSVAAADRALTSVIVRAEAGAENAAARAVQSFGGKVGTALPLIDGFQARVPVDTVSSLRYDASVVSVTPNYSLKLAGTTYEAQADSNSLYKLENFIGARYLWSRYTGAGVDVAVLDSGVTPVDGLDTPGKVLNGPDLTEESQNPSTNHLDTFGHGTFMASIIAGHDDGVNAATNQSNATPFLGVAPDARIVSVKVADAVGATDVSQVIAGIAWIVQHAHDRGLNVRILNLSFGTDSDQGYRSDPLAYAAEVAWQSGIAVVVSAGNDGTSNGHLNDPAIDPYVIAVGADDLNGTWSASDDSVPAFSSRGNGSRNPDFVAPGAHVQGLRVPGSFIDAHYGDTGMINARFFRGSGTSEAAAMTSGALALLVQEHPNYSPDQLKALLTRTTSTVNAPATAAGNGLINLRAASGSVYLGGSSQWYYPSSGAGSLNASRGSATLVLNNVPLTGERDIFGKPVNTASLATAEANGTSWSGGTWNGTSWSGTSWSGTSWSGTSWSGTSWSGTSWSSANWSTGTWDGTSWSGTSWSGTSWSGTSWSGTSWSGTSWSDADWSDAVWASDSWS